MRSLTSIRSLSRRIYSAGSLSRRYSTPAGNSVKPYYITTPIFYPNAAPHIGHLHSLVVADIYARYAKLADPDRSVHFVNGTDEHGLKIQNAAKAQGMDPLDFCNELSEKFRDLIENANISVTRFTRTTEKQHCDAVSHLWKELHARNLIYKGKHEGWYSVSDETFYPATQVVKQEKDGQEYYISTTSGSRVEWQEEENYKFRLSAFQSSLVEHYTANPDVIQPPQFHADVMNALQEPLDDLSISRKRSRLSWGIPVPDDPEHTIYVWIDALTTYLSSVGYPWSESGDNGYSAGWPPDVQVIGKDILRFHAIYFPAMLQALDLPLAKRLLTHSHWTVDRAKMSKSVGNVADPIKIINDIGPDLVRYYLARVGGRFKDDVDWSRSQLRKHGKEIISFFGNLYLRATSERIMKRVAAVPKASVANIKDNTAVVTGPFIANLKRLSSRVRQHMEQFQLTDAIEVILEALQEANLLMTVAQPWHSSTSLRASADVQALVFETLRQCAILLQPVMPEKTARWQTSAVRIIRSVALGLFLAAAGDDRVVRPTPPLTGMHTWPDGDCPSARIHRHRP
ncbi:hypothetical protein FKP32DRAFT_1661126 [Trametes sanguinea]|nr:hypothetical protein FKP32DRAFT_1661126 [Trametes sanguinea]